MGVGPAEKCVAHFPPGGRQASANYSWRIESLAAVNKRSPYSVMGLLWGRGYCTWIGKLEDCLHEDYCCTTIRKQRCIQSPTKSSLSPAY